MPKFQTLRTTVANIIKHFDLNVEFLQTFFSKNITKNLYSALVDGREVLNGKYIDIKNKTRKFGDVMRSGPRNFHEKALISIATVFFPQEWIANAIILNLPLVSVLTELEAAKSQHPIEELLEEIKMDRKATFEMNDSKNHLSSRYFENPLAKEIGIGIELTKLLSKTQTALSSVQDPIMPSDNMKQSKRSISESWLEAMQATPKHRKSMLQQMKERPIGEAFPLSKHPK